MTSLSASQMGSQCRLSNRQSRTSDTDNAKMHLFQYASTFGSLIYAIERTRQDTTYSWEYVAGEAMLGGVL